MFLIGKFFPLIVVCSMVTVIPMLKGSENGLLQHEVPIRMVDSLIISHPSLMVGEDTLFYYPTWSEDLGLLLKTGNNSVTIDPALGQWKSSNPSVLSVLNGRVHALAPGMATITVEMNSAVKGTAFIKVYSPSRPPVTHQLPKEMLEWGDECAVKDMPVLIIRYLPTADGNQLDVHHAPDFYELGEVSLATLEQKLNEYDQRIKFGLEEGTRFRDYGSNTKIPYLGYRVVAMMTVYEPTPRGKVLSTDVNGLPVFGVDYFTVFERLRVENYIRNFGVKEVWFWQYNIDSGYPSYQPELHPSSNFRFMPESNMSSLITGDVSNSIQIQDDLPIYDKTYIVYGQNIRRSQAEVIHNHGHQIERMIPYINRKQDGNDYLFWRKFVGKDEQNNFIQGRCGWTHMPPNTIVNYDYESTTAVLSDIKNWRPNGGMQELVNVNTWGNINYHWPGATEFPQRKESQWYLFWLQSLPGHYNMIDYNSSFLTNWWDIIADWDFVNQTNFKLYRSTPDSLNFNHTHLTVDICKGETYDYEGMAFSVSGDYRIKRQSQSGCDSIILLTIIVHSEVLTVRNETICSGENIVVNGEIFDTPGQYDIHIEVQDGCDTLVRLSLSVIDIDKTVILQGITLFAYANGVSCQWIDCSTGLDIPDAINRIFHPTISGVYAVRLTSPAGCVAISDCTAVIITALQEPSSNTFLVYPNPGNTSIYIQRDDRKARVVVTIFDHLGRRISLHELDQGDYLNVDHLHAGEYILSITSGSETVIRKLVVD